MKTLNWIMGILAILLLFPSLIACTEKEKEDIRVESVSLNKTEITLEEGESFTLVASVLPEDAKYDEVIWTSGNESVATVSGNGEVVAVAEGQTKITARVDNKMASCEVSVTKAVVTGISLDKDRAQLKIDEQLTLVATVTPDNVRDVVIKWDTDNAAIASVTQDGIVTGNSVGKAKITVSAGGFSDICEVEVMPIEAESVTLNKSEITLECGDFEQLTAIVGPSNTTDKNVVWTSEDEAIATVSDGLVTAVSEGVVVIRATCGNVYGECEVTVTPQTTPRYAIGDIFEIDGKKGVVFYITDNGKHGKIISLYSSEDGIWSTNSNLVGASSTTDGRANTEKIRSMPDYPDAYPSFKWLDETYGTDWYFPAQEEVAQVMKVRSQIEDVFWGYNVLGSWIPSSTEANAAQYIDLRTNYEGGYTVTSYNKNEWHGDIRAVYEF